MLSNHPDKNFSLYSKFAATEFLNHASESIISFVFAALCKKTSSNILSMEGSNYYIKIAFCNLNHFLDLLKVINIKDSIVEALTAISYLPVLNLVGWYSISENTNPKNNIGAEEHFSQTTEFANKLVPFALYDILIDSDLKAKQSIFAVGRDYTVWSGTIAFIKVPMYGLYDSLYPNKQYISNDYFNKEGELHFNIEGSLLFTPAVFATLVTRFSNNFLLNEFISEIIKGAEFEFIGFICPSCSVIRDNVVGSYSEWMSNNLIITPNMIEHYYLLYG